MDMRPHSRGAFSPELCIFHHPRKTEGAGKAGWPHAPGALAQKTFARARKPQVQAVITPAFPARWFYGLYVISSVNHPVCHRNQRDALGIIADLAPDLWGARTTRFRRPRKKPLVSRAPSRPPLPRLTCRDDRDTSLCERGRMGHTVLQFYISKNRNIFQSKD